PRASRAPASTSSRSPRSASCSCSAASPSGAGRVPSSTAIEPASAAEPAAVAADLARRLRPGDVVLVSGDLGAGKTTFVRGACRALGVTANVTSTTFTIGELYAGRPAVAHLDLYRLERAEPEILDDYMTPDRIAFMEWPELAEP